MSVYDIDPDATLDFSITYAGFLTDGDQIIFSEWKLPEGGACIVDHSWNGVISTAWLSPNDTAKQYLSYPVHNRVYSEIEAVTGLDIGIDAVNNRVTGIFTGFNRFEGKKCLRLAGFENEENNGMFDVVSVAFDQIVFDDPGFVDEAAGELRCVSAGRVADKTFAIRIMEN